MAAGDHRRGRIARNSPGFCVGPPARPSRLPPKSWIVLARFENPFTLNAGTAQIVSYVLAANPEGREANELGDGGSAVILQTGVPLRREPAMGRSGLSLTTYLNAIDKGPDGDRPRAHSKAGLGFLTLRAKVELFGSSGSDAGLALVPFVVYPPAGR